MRSGLRVRSLPSLMEVLLMLFGSIEKKMEKIKALGTKGNWQKLVKIAGNKDASLRAAAASALANIKVDEAYNTLVNLTRDGDKSVRKAAVVALGIMGRKSGQDHVRHAMEGETDPDFIQACQTAISQIINSDSHR